MTRSPLFAKAQPGFGPASIDDVGRSTGHRFFVDSNADAAGTSSSHGHTPDIPLSSLDAAFGGDHVVADRGDIVYVAPGHSESTSTAAAELFDIDVAGVTIIGQGVGDNRPTFTLAHASASCVIGAAGVRLSNIRIVGNVSDLAAALEIEAAATGCRIDNCYFTDSGTSLDCLIFLSVAANADRLMVEGCHFNGTVGGEATNAIKFAGGCDGLIIRRNVLTGDWKGSDGAVGLAGAASGGVVIHDNHIVNADGSAGLCIDLHSSTTGGIFRNFVAGSKSNTETVSGGEAAHFAENFGNDAPATSGILTPSTETSWIT